MKKIIAALLVLLAAGVASAQNHKANDAQAAKFVKYYNAGKPDSIYTLLSNAGKAKVPLPGVSSAVTQLKGLLGDLVSQEYYQAAPNGGDTYVAVFEKSGPVLYLSFSKEHKLTGFFTDVDKRVSPGSVAIKSAGADLRGTLTVPNGTGKVPVVLIIAGSGPTDRNGNTVQMNIRPNSYLLLADAFKQSGIATLRYDKRMVGQSTATKPQAQTTFDDMINDAIACIRFLKADGRFSKIIIAGHSEGSLIGMIACQREKVDGFISLAGPGFPLDQVLKQQIKANGTEPSYRRAAPIIDSIKAGQTIKQKLEPGFENLFGASLQTYMHSLFQYKPQQELAKVTVPVLIVQGTTDIQVGLADALALKKAKPDAKVQIVNGMSHILKEGPEDRQQNAATYLKANLPLHPELAPALVNFIKSVK
ncbi:alpha/beta fold hydrolase [Mucilaginibacter panaciglaebae]|uniref:Serine aminopeptidase S33 domain-containing protein n=1 Tax=Mucilaginibacter panaciglaebae TaxID=502331 RepID=A0ABP7WQ99_9SPHI